MGAIYVFYCVKRNEENEKEKALWFPYLRPNTPETNCHTWNGCPNGENERQ